MKTTPGAACFAISAPFFITGEHSAQMIRPAHPASACTHRLLSMMSSKNRKMRGRARHQHAQVAASGLFRAHLRSAQQRSSLT